uniref:Uncharacterized protein n=1 Tax=Anguilla anguilla TaxID=7936 RepID=A0A0E9S0I9_ANGAN
MSFCYIPKKSANVDKIGSIKIQEIR